jgi:hypothetical protein
LTFFRFRIAGFPFGATAEFITPFQPISEREFHILYNKFCFVALSGNPRGSGPFCLDPLGGLNEVALNKATFAHDAVNGFFVLFAYADKYECTDDEWDSCICNLLMTAPAFSG